MPLKVKNVAAGWYNETGFHPIRRSPDYDPDRAGDDYGSKSDGAGLKRGRKAGTKRVKAKTKRTATKRATTKRRKPAAKKRAVKRVVKRVKKAIKNPVPAKWTKARVKRLPSGDIQVMLIGK